MVYLIITLLLLFLIYTYDYRKIEFGRITWMVVLLVLFILVAGLRYRLGTDSVRYEIYFNKYPDLAHLTSDNFKNSRFSPLYIILNSTVKTFTDQFYIFQLVHATILNCVVFYFFYKNCRHVFLAILFYFIFLYVNLNTEVLRESLAMSVFLLAWPYYKKNNWLGWYICSVIAFLFHVSAVFMFIVPVITLPVVRNLFIFGNRTILVCAIIFCFSGLINVLLFRYIQSLAMLENVAERATVYSKTDMIGMRFNLLGVISMLFLYVLYPILALYVLKKKRRIEGEPTNGFDKFESMNILCIYMSILGIGIFIFLRYQNYLLFFPFALIADFIFSRIPVRYNRWFKMGFVYWIIFLIPWLGVEFYTTYLPKVNQSGTLKKYMNYYPYSSVLNPEKDEDREKVFRYNHTH